MHCYNDKGIQNHRTVGVTVDAVPVLRVKPYQIKKLAIHSHHGYCAHNRSKHGYDVLTPNAATFLPLSWVRYVDRGDVYQLVRLQKLDTGIIENNILKDLPTGVKQGFRIAKYLLQYCFKKWTTTRPLPKASFEYQPLVKSYLLRMCFLHLLIQTRCMENKEVLTGGVLALCLQVMLGRFLDKYCGQYVKHPILSYEAHRVVIYEWPALKDKVKACIHEICTKYATTEPFNDLETFKLINWDHVPYPPLIAHIYM